MLLTTKVARASPSMSSAMIPGRLGGFGYLFQQGQHFADV